MRITKRHIALAYLGALFGAAECVEKPTNTELLYYGYY